MEKLTTLGRNPGPEALDRLIEGIPYAAFLGIRAVPAGDELTTILPFKHELIGNPVLPALHGGVIGAFLETTAILELLIKIESENLPKPVNITVEYLRSGKPVDTFARAFVTKLGRRVVNVRAEAWQTERARPIAAIHGHFALTPRDEMVGTR